MLEKDSDRKFLKVKKWNILLNVNQSQPKPDRAELNLMKTKLKTGAVNV